MYSEREGSLITAYGEQRNRRFNHGPLVWVALVCLVLLAVLAMAQALHTHDGISDTDHCPLCIVLHAAAPILASAAIIALVQVATASAVLEIRPITRNWHAQLFTRPPPFTS